MSGVQFKKSGANAKLSAFVLVTNAIKNEFPFLESITSWAEAVDEVVVIDGGSYDGTIKAIEELNKRRGRSRESLRQSRYQQRRNSRRLKP